MTTSEHTLITELRMDRITGSGVPDDSGNEHAGTIAGTVDLVDDETFGKCMEFGGGSGDYISLPGTAVPSGALVSLSFWAYGGDALPNKNKAFWATNAEGQRTLGVHLPWTSERVYLDCGNEGSDYDRIDKPCAASDYQGRWTHWAFTKNATTGKMCIYMDGALWHHNSGNNKGRLLEASADVQIGAGYAGRIALLRVDQAELSSAQIVARMEQDRFALRTGQCLNSGEFIQSTGKTHFAILQASGNFCIYRGSGPGDNQGFVWATGTGGSQNEAHFASMGHDGNFCIYRGSGPGDNQGSVWASRSDGERGKYLLILRDDGKLRVNNQNGGTVWMSDYSDLDSPPDLPLGTIALYKDNQWSSGKLEIDLSSGVYRTPETFYSLSNTDMQDKATWMAYNLPPGHVATFLDNVNKTSGQGIDFVASAMRGGGKSLTIIGDECRGATLAVDIRNAQMSDIISAFFWRIADTSLGWVRLHRDTNLGGNCATFILGEMRVDEPLNLEDWFMHDRASSVSWSDLSDKIKFMLFEHKGASGKSHLLPGERDGSIADLDSLGLENKVSSVQWSNIGKPLTKEQLVDVIERYGPMLYLDEQERYQPSSVEWFLERAELHGKDGSKAPATQLPQGQQGPDAYWLELPEANDRSGDLASAVAYVHALQSERSIYTDVQFWFFYPYNGPGTLRAKSLVLTGTAHSGNTEFDELGRHTGDWEHVTLRFDNNTRELAAVCFDQHGDAHWVTDLSKLSREGEQVVVYSSRNGHASYQGIGGNYSEHHKWTEAGTGLEVFLVNRTSKGAQLDCSTRYELISASYLGAGAPAEPAWLNFMYRWGPRETSRLSHSDVEDILRSALGGALPIVNRYSAQIPRLAALLLPLFVKQDENGPEPPKVKTAIWAGQE